MDLVLCRLTYLTCLVYLDDIIVYASDFETHLKRVREVSHGCAMPISNSMQPSAVCFRDA